jgi:hypothetical protein
MTPKEKAQELVDKFMNIPPQKLSDYSRIDMPTAKKCARLVCYESMKALTFLPYGLEYLNQVDYWEEVQNEIDNL